MLNLQNKEKSEKLYKSALESFKSFFDIDILDLLTEENKIEWFEKSGKGNKEFCPVMLSVYNSIKDECVQPMAEVFEVADNQNIKEKFKEVFKQVSLSFIDYAIDEVKRESNIDLSDDSLPNKYLDEHIIIFDYVIMGLRESLSLREGERIPNNYGYILSTYADMLNGRLNANLK